MKKITTLLCGAALAAALAAPVHAGGQSTTGSSTTAPASVLAALQRFVSSNVVGAELGTDGWYVVTFGNGQQTRIKSRSIAFLVSLYGERS